MAASGESVTRLTDFGFAPKLVARRQPRSWSRPITFVSPSGIQGRDHRLVDRRREVRTGARIAGSRCEPCSRHGRQTARASRTGACADRLDSVTSGPSPPTDPMPAAAACRSPTTPRSTGTRPGRPTAATSTSRALVAVQSTSGASASTSDSGHALDEPEPVTTPSTWSGYLSFSRDGTRLAFASQAFQSTLLRVPFDAGARGGDGHAGADPARAHARSGITSCHPTASGSRSPRPACQKISSSRASTARNTAG